MFIYQGHMGSLFSSNDPIDFNDLYCETCGDFDWELGNVESQEELLQLLADDIAALPGDGGWDMDYVLDFAHSCFTDERRVGRKKAKAIIVGARTTR